DLSVEGAAPSFAKTILAVLDARDVSSAHLAGHSLGGAIAVLMALFDPSRITSLTLLAPGGFGPEINAPLLRDFASAVSDDEIVSCLRVMAGPGFEPSPEVVLQCRAERSVPWH